MAENYLEKLLKLQSLDLRLRDLELRLKSLPIEMKNMISRRDKLKAENAEAAEAVRRIELDIRSSEADISRLADENDRLLQQSSQVKKQSEYQAMLQAIENNKRKVSELEEKVILLYDKLEETKKVCVITRKNNNDKILILKSEFDEMIAFSKTVEKEIAVLKQQRPDAAKQLPDDVLSTYNRLLNGRSGRNPVCEIEDGICSGCHLKITPQTMNDVVRLQVAFCDNCQSFIYIP